MPKYVKVQGTWKAVDESADCGKVKVNGVWRTVSNSYVKVANVWKAVCAPAPASTTTTTTTPVTTTTTTTTVPVTTTTTVPVTTTTTAQAYPNISSAIAYGAGAGQAWTSNAAYITWGGSGWGSYTVIASNGSSSNSASSAGGPPVLLTGFSASTTYSVTVTLFANANYSGQSASASTSFTTAAATTTTTTTPVCPFPGMTGSYDSPCGNTCCDSDGRPWVPPTTTTTSSTTTTTTTAPAVNPGTVYLSYCYNNAPLVESYTVDANNVLTTDINQACSVYTTLLTNIGATSISCSIVSARTSPTGCAGTSTTTTTTTASYPTLLSGFHLCAAGDAPNPSSPCPSNGSGTGVNCVENGASGASCPNPTATTTTATTTTAATTTTTAATTTTVNCNTCDRYIPDNGTYPYTDTDPYGTCASGSRYYRICYTPAGCANTNSWGSCVPAATTTTTVASTTTTVATTTSCSNYKYNCKSYDVTNSASVNYYQCYTTGQCAANYNSDGSRTTCCAG